LNFPRVASVCDAPVVGLSDADGAGIAPEETVSLAAGEVDAADFGVALGVVRGGGDGSDGITLRGVIFVSGVDVATAVGAGVADIVADGNGVAVAGVDEAGVSAP
jgi:hypothetical protein